MNRVEKKLVSTLDLLRTYDIIKSKIQGGSHRECTSFAEIMNNDAVLLGRSGAALGPLCVAAKRRMRHTELK